MKKILIALLSIAFFAQCSAPKDAATTVTKPMVKNEDFRSSPPAPGPAPKINFGETQKFTLDNGLKVIVVENHKLPRVSFQLSVDTWPFTEGNIAGAADLTGQLLSAGTATMSKSEIDQAIDFVGARMNTSARGVFGTSLSKHKETLLGIMSEVLLNPIFPEDQLDKFKKQTISGLRASKENPERIANIVGGVLNYGKNSALGEITTEGTVENVTIEDCKKYYQKYFKPNISYLVIVGDITGNEAKTLANKYFGAWKSGDVEREMIPMSMAPQGRTVDFVHKEGAVQSVINITYPIEFSRKSEDYAAALLLNTLFGGPFGRLDLNLREDKGYTYGARSSLSASRWVGEFSTNTSVRNEVTDSSIINILQEFDKIINEPLSQKDLEFVRNYRSGNFAMSLEQPQTLANFALTVERQGLPADFYETLLQKLEKVTVEDVQAAAKKYLRPDNAHFLIVGSKEEVSEKLKQFSPDGKVNFYDTLGDPVEEIEGGIPPGMTAEKVIEDYLNAIGGKSVIEGVKSVISNMKATLPMGEMQVSQTYMAPDKAKITVSLGGNVMQNIVVNGDKGKASGMGGSQVLEGDDLKKTLADTHPFGEMLYAANGFGMELKGLEVVGDSKCYKVEITKSEESKVVEFYDIMSSLKIKSVATAMVNGQAMNTTFEFSDYKEVDGIMFPHKIAQSGGPMPFPINMEMVETKVNRDVTADDFKIE